VGKLIIGKDHSVTPPSTRLLEPIERSADKRSRETASTKLRTNSKVVDVSASTIEPAENGAGYRMIGLGDQTQLPVPVQKPAQLRRLIAVGHPDAGCRIP
jgi:hypothetical protein